MATASLSIEANSGRGTREYVAAALDVLDELGLHYEFTPMSTNLEGDVSTIASALRTIHARCHELGASRVVSLLKIDDRIDIDQTLKSKVAHVNEFRAARRRKADSKRRQRAYTFIRNGFAQVATFDEDAITIWTRCPHCGSADVRINPDTLDANRRRHEPRCRLSCVRCERCLDDIAIDPAVPRYYAAAHWGIGLEESAKPGFVDGNDTATLKTHSPSALQLG